MSLPKYQFLSDEKTKEMLKVFKGERTGWVQVGQKKWFFPYRYTEQGQGFYKFKARQDDTWVLSYPRSGTTWTQELVWLLSNNLDYKKANGEFLSKRFPFLEFSMFNHPEVTKEFIEANEGDSEKQELCLEIAKPGYEILAGLESPRFIKSHFPFSLLPGILDTGCKIIYVARNPKDVAVSWYHLNKAIQTQHYIGNFEEFWNYFQEDLTPWSPYWEHIEEAWNLRHRSNVLFMFYEEMKDNLPMAIKKVSDFLGKTYNEEEILKLSDHLNIKNFRNNPMVNMSELKDCNIIKDGVFVRKNEERTLENYFSLELEKQADKWIENYSKRIDNLFSFDCNHNKYCKSDIFSRNIEEKQQ